MEICVPAAYTSSRMHSRAQTHTYTHTRTHVHAPPVILAQGVASLVAFGQIFVSPAMDERPRRCSSSSELDLPPALPPEEEPVQVELSCPSAIGLVAQHDAEYFYLKGLVRYLKDARETMANIDGKITELGVSKEHRRGGEVPLPASNPHLAP